MFIAAVTSGDNGLFAAKMSDRDVGSILSPGGKSDAESSTFFLSICGSAFGADQEAMPVPISGSPPLWRGSGGAGREGCEYTDGDGGVASFARRRETSVFAHDTARRRAASSPSRPCSRALVEQSSAASCSRFAWHHKRKKLCSLSNSVFSFARAMGRGCPLPARIKRPRLLWGEFGNRCTRHQGNYGLSFAGYMNRKATNNTRRVKLSLSLSLACLGYGPPVRG